MLIIISLFSSYVLFRLTASYLKKNKPEKYLELSKKLHLPSQVAPPFILLLFITNHGPALWMIMMVHGLVFIVSALSIIVKLFSLRKNKKLLIRPSLSIVFVLIIFSIANESIKTAEQETLALAHKIQIECTNSGECPSNMLGWQELTLNKSYRKLTGHYIQYPVYYNRTEDGFTLYLTQSIDLGRTYKAGVNEAVTVTGP